MKRSLVKPASRAGFIGSLTRAYISWSLEESRRLVERNWPAFSVRPGNSFDTSMAPW
ncbi:hypothetical protein D3C84_1011180 [compost metagenome]